MRGKRMVSGVRGGFTVSREQTYTLLSLVALLAVWSYAAATQDVMLASPSEVLFAWVELVESGELPASLARSLKHMFLGYALAIAVGVPLGFLMGRSKVIRWAVNPYVDAIYATPTIAYVPLIIVWLGLGLRARIFVVFIFSFFEILLNTYEGAKSVDEKYLDVGRSFGLGWIDRQSKILLPAALPNVFTGLRIGIGRAVRGMIVAELFLAVVNLGSLLEVAASQFDTATQLAIIFTITLVGVVFQNAVLLVERTVVPWKGPTHSEA